MFNFSFRKKRKEPILSFNYLRGNRDGEGDGEKYLNRKRVKQEYKESLSGIGTVTLTDQYQKSLAQYNSSPTYWGLVELIKTSIIPPNGTPWEAEDPRVHKVLTQFWDYSPNRWREEGEYLRFRDLILNGELSLPTLWQKSRKTVELGYIHPTNVAEIIWDEGNNILPEKIKYSVGDKTVIKDIITDRKGKWQGDVFYTRLNYQEGGRGLPYFYPLISLEIMMDFDQLIMDQFENLSAPSQLLDVVVKGSISQAELRERVNNWRRRKISANNVVFHGEDEEWSVKGGKPHSDTSSDIYLIKSILLGWCGMTDLLFGGGRHQPRAASKQSLRAAFARLSYLQNKWHQILLELFNFVIEEAIRHRVLRSNVNKTVNILPCMMPLQLFDELVGETARLISALAAAERAGLIEGEELNRVVKQSISDRIYMLTGRKASTKEERELIR